jgi:hypothetical protein
VLRFLLVTSHRLSILGFPCPESVERFRTTRSLVLFRLYNGARKRGYPLRMYDCNIDFCQALSSIRAKRWSQQCSPSLPPRHETHTRLSRALLRARCWPVSTAHRSQAQRSLGRIGINISYACAFSILRVCNPLFQPIGVRFCLSSRRRRLASHVMDRLVATHFQRRQPGVVELRRPSARHHTLNGAADKH